MFVISESPNEAGSKFLILFGESEGGSPLSTDGLLEAVSPSSVDRFGLEVAQMKANLLKFWNFTTDLVAYKRICPKNETNHGRTGDSETTLRSLNIRQGDLCNESLMGRKWSLSTRRGFDQSRNDWKYLWLLGSRETLIWSTQEMYVNLLLPI